jgi:branched-chain amino acid transport system permease protein
MSFAAAALPYRPNFIERALAQLTPANVVVAFALVIFPTLASDFITFQIGAYSLLLGTVALSLMLLAGHGGMVSLAQLTVAGIAGYSVAIFGANSTAVMGLGWPWWVAVPFAILIGGVAAALIGAISVRTEGIYTIMITLAIAAAFSLFARQNYVLFNGFSGFAGVKPPVLWGVFWRDPLPFYYLSLAVAALSYGAVIYAARAPFGLALQAIRDNPRRMRALGFNVTAHKIAAWFYAGLIAATAGVMLVWFNGRIAPSAIGVGQAIDILIIAVVGGLRRPIGPYLGALLFVLLKTFAVDVIGADRFNTLIGLVFLAVIFVSKDGILGFWERFSPHLAPQSLSAVSGEAARR